MLPACALAGDLKPSRDIFAGGNLAEAWTAVLAAIEKRPFHPEAFLLLAQIARAAGDSVTARHCAELARNAAPGWKAPNSFLSEPSNRATRPQGLRLPQSLTSAHQRLSVCLITKNEERFIAQCLKSIRAVASQIVVVDTGSEDRTVHIALELGAEVFHWEWIDDFSAARNAALEQARGDWVLVLDADEELSADHVTQLQSDLKRARALALRLPLVNSGRETEGHHHVPRLFRNVPGAYYQMRIHEQVFPSLLPMAKTWGLEIGVGTALLVHHGYSAEMTRTRNKVQRNLALLHRAVEESPENANLVMNLGLEWVRSNELQLGLTQYERAFQLLSAQPVAEIPPELREVLLTQFTYHLYQAEAYERVTSILNSPLARNGGLTASLHFRLGLAQFHLQRHREAAEQMRHCLAKAESPTFSPIDPQIRSAAPHHCLAACLARLGDPGAAEAEFRSGLTKAGQTQELKLDYARFLADQNRALEALHQLNEIVAEDARQSAAWRLGGYLALSQPEFLAFAQDWTGEAIKQLPDDPVIRVQRAQALLLGQCIAEARPLWDSVWRQQRTASALAAVILCDLVLSQNAHQPRDEAERHAASREFLLWYRRAVSVGAQSLVRRLNDSSEALCRVLPEAGRVLSDIAGQLNREPEQGALI
ncbi:MAG TPA: glycosyltransferase [Clostridia bacterium]|nr:glycosyltransferase [Clostridia bacterium]